MSELSSSPQVQEAPSTLGARLKSASFVVVNHVRKHTGVGIICAVAYFDPGNWGVDLQAGSQFGYRLLFIVLLAGIFAIFLQVSASRLGCVTGLDLASHCRLLLHDRPKHKLLYRWLGFYPLYVLAETAIIATDLAELLGSAISLCLLFPRLELWHGVLITSVDVVFVLALGDPLRGRPVKMFEFLIAGLVFAVLICMVIIISKVDVDWGDAFDGYVPSKFIFKSGALYTSVGILGATVMPHSLFLGSALATQDRISHASKDKKRHHLLALSSSESKDSSESALPLSTSTSIPYHLKHCIISFKQFIISAFRKPPPNTHSTLAKRHSERENNSLGFVKAHIYHGMVDVVINLLGFAVVINSLILILASAVFFFGRGAVGVDSPASLFDAYDLIRDLIGQPAATLFAIALLAAGQSSSIIATVSGQAVAEGFLQWRLSPVVRRLVTRLIAIIPSMIVAIAVGKDGVNTLLVASQVALSIVLPFITVPLVWLTSSKSVMSVRREEVNGYGEVVSTINTDPDESKDAAIDGDIERSGGVASEMVDFSNGKVATAVGCVICLVVIAANVYVIVALGLGTE